MVLRVDAVVVKDREVRRDVKRSFANGLLGMAVRKRARPAAVGWWKGESKELNKYRGLGVRFVVRRSQRRTARLLTNVEFGRRYSLVVGICVRVWLWSSQAKFLVAAFVSA